MVTKASTEWFSGLTTEVEVNSLNVTIIITDQNQPPEIANPIADQNLDEDFDRVQIADLSEVFHDADDNA